MDAVKERGAENTIEYISRLRIFATVSVIWLHTCSTLTDNREYFGISDTQYYFFTGGVSDYVLGSSGIPDDHGCPDAGQKSLISEMPE